MPVRSPDTTTVSVLFRVDPCLPPAEAPIHDALRSLRGFELDAPTTEMAESYGALLLDALERAGNSPASGSGRA